MKVIADLLQPKEEVLNKSLEGVIHAYRVETENRLESNPKRFFSSTYPSNSIKNVLDLVGDKLNYKSSKGNFVLSGPRGSGKSHALVTLYHIFQHPEEANSWLKEWSIALDVPTESKSLIVSAQKVDPDLLWEPIFKKAGREDLLEEVGRYPTTDTIEKLVQDDVLAIFLDEFGTWWKTFESDETEILNRNQMFIQNLGEVAEEKDYQLLTFVTTYGSVGGLDKTLNRTDPIREDMSASGDREKIIFHRFFEDNQSDLNKDGIKEIVCAYTEKYREPIQIENLKRYEKDFINSYPFHPQLLEKLDGIYEGAQDRQNVRGEMTVLANVLADKYDKTDVITLSDLKPKAFRNLDRELVRKYITDVENVREELNYGEDILKVILLYSFEDGVVGASQSDILLGNYKPTEGMNLSDLSMDLDNLYGKAKYLHKTNSHYVVKKDVEVYALIDREVQDIPDSSDEVLTELKSIIKTDIFNDSVYIYEFGKDSIKDDQENKIVISLQSFETEDNLKKELEEFFEGRQFQNNIIFIIPKTENLLTDRRLIDKLKRIVAGKDILRGLEEESAKVKRILKEDKQETVDYLQDAYGIWIKWVKRKGTITFRRQTVEPNIRNIRETARTDKSQLRDTLIEELEGEEKGRPVGKLLKDLKRMRKYPYVSDDSIFYSVVKDLNREKIVIQGDRAKDYLKQDPQGEIKDDWLLRDIDYVSQDEITEEEDFTTEPTSGTGAQVDFGDEDIPTVTPEVRTEKKKQSAEGNSPRAVSNKFEMSLNESSIKRITDVTLFLNFEEFTKEDLLDFIESLPECNHLNVEIEIDEIVED